MRDPGVEIARQYYAAYETHDRSALELLLTEDFRFTSPVDDDIDKAAYLARCWPNHEHIAGFQFLTLERAEGHKVISRYRVEWRPDPSLNFRCMECIQLENGRIKGIDTYFGFVPTGKPFIE